MENDTFPLAPPTPVLTKWDHYVIALASSAGWLDNKAIVDICGVADIFVAESNKRKNS